ncbi:MAG: ATP-grasp domain-containing protein [Candidatus Diapherotrites archaeon]|jgi:glutathione synthase/RimK-type ligase-like ATP-grasp enzyme|uniref:ATP-grasp domain-containing protein n=1 Tax=Candidatus Iainarchaeum sp. TaxID=3101447 RepID=A0A8T5GG29_9ARCH|nr:ATP-grasp domain-containing protein [Candidatus Diapherotrites archaeon]
MRILVIAEKQKYAQSFVDAMKSKGVKANYLRILKISLVSKHKNTLIKALGEDIPKYDAVFLQARTSLAPFVEPLLEELARKGIYVNCSPGSYFVGMNAPYKFVTLSLAGVKTPRTLTSGSGKNIERISKKVSYPLLAKSFKGRDVQQSIVVENEKDLTSFVKSIKHDLDGFMLREFIDGDMLSCAVIGEKVFAVNRKINDFVVSDLEKGVCFKPSEDESKEAILAAKACGYDIAWVDLVNGHVIKVEPELPWKKFNKLCSETLEEHVANFYIDKINEKGAKKYAVDDLKDLSKAVSKTIFSRLLK